jgi:phosphate transport system substrate-binding protein
LSYRHSLKILFLIAMFVPVAAARDIALVSNKSNAIATITPAELVKVCKAQSNRWPDGKPVTLVMRPPSAPEMKMVLEKLYEMSEGGVNDLINAANHGRVGHPAILVVTSDEELVNKVASTPGAVGLVDVYSINSSVTVVKIGGKLPLEPGYLLHGN